MFAKKKNIAHHSLSEFSLHTHHHSPPSTSFLQISSLKHTHIYIYIYFSPSTDPCALGRSAWAVCNTFVSILTNKHERPFFTVCSGMWMRVPRRGKNHICIYWSLHREAWCKVQEKKTKQIKSLVTLMKPQMTNPLITASACGWRRSFMRFAATVNAYEWGGNTVN